MNKNINYLAWIFALLLAIPTYGASILVILIFYMVKLFIPNKKANKKTLYSIYKQYLDYINLKYNCKLDAMNHNPIKLIEIIEYVYIKHIKNVLDPTNISPIYEIINNKAIVLSFDIIYKYQLLCGVSDISPINYIILQQLINEALKEHKIN